MRRYYIYNRDVLKKNKRKGRSRKLENKEKKRVINIICYLFISLFCLGFCLLLFLFIVLVVFLYYYISIKCFSCFEFYISSAK